MNTDDYRRRYEDELTGDDAPDGHLRNALDVLADASAGSGERVEAATTVSALAYDSPAALELQLGILVDEDEDTEVRMVVVDGMRRHRFSSQRVKSRRSEMTTALKQAMQSENVQLREQAVAVLATENDVDAQRVLIDGLRDPAAAVTTTQRSVELLGHDRKADHYEVLREVVETNDDDGARTEAIRLLAADGDSKALIERVVRDKDEISSVRVAGASALQATAPEHFEAVAKSIVADVDDYPEIKVAALGRLTAQQVSVDVTDNFVAEVARARDSLTSDDPLHVAAERYTDQHGV